MEKAVQFRIVETIDSISNSISLVKGMSHAFNEAMECLSIPTDPVELDRLNTFQVTAMTLLEVVCNNLKTASNELHNCIRNSEEDAQNV